MKWSSCPSFRWAMNRTSKDECQLHYISQYCNLALTGSQEKYGLWYESAGKWKCQQGSMQISQEITLESREVNQNALHPDSGTQMIKSEHWISKGVTKDHSSKMTWTFQKFIGQQWMNRSISSALAWGQQDNLAMKEMGARKFQVFRMDAWQDAEGGPFSSQQVNHSMRWIQNKKLLNRESIHQAAQDRIGRQWIDKRKFKKQMVKFSRYTRKIILKHWEINLL